MKKLFSALSVLILSCGAVVAQTAQEYMQLGNQAYEKQDFTQAKEFYTDAIKAGGKSAELYFNLANTNAKLGKKGEALLYYAKANVVAPRLREAEANLKIFAKDNAINIPQKNAVEIYLLELSMYEWILIAFASFWFVVLFLVVPPLYNKQNSVSIFASLIFIVILSIGIYGIVRWQNINNTAIALSDDVALRISPTSHAPVVSTVHEGIFAKILSKKNNFIYVLTPSGKRGWASTAEFSPIQE